MPQAAIEEIEAMREGQRSIWFAGVKGFLKGIVYDIKNSVSAMLTSFVVGGAVGILALTGAAVAGAMGWAGADQQTLASGFKELVPEGSLGGAFKYVGSIALASSAMALGWVGGVEARKEVKHARNINHLIDLEVQHVKGMAHSRVQQKEALAEPAPAHSDPVMADVGMDGPKRRSHTRMLDDRRALAAEAALLGQTIH